MTLAGGAVLASGMTSADSYVSTVTVDVPEACSITSSNTNVNADDEYVIERLVTPGLWVPDMATYTTSVTCNDRNGYSVYAVGYGNDTVGSTNLVGTATNEIIPTGTDTSTNTSNWMFKLTPISGSATPTPWPDGGTPNAAGYYAIPSTQTKVMTYTDGININTPSQFTTTYGIATTSAQTADTYTGKVKYTLVHPNYTESDGSTPVAMQDLTLSACQKNVVSGIGDPFVAIDARDGNDYTVRYINGECWMTQNLRLTGGAGVFALNGTLSNVSSYVMPAESTSNFSATTGYDADGHTCSADKNTGCWYNYYSATAGTVSGDSNTTAATSDICPKNWHLPSGPNTTAGTDFNTLVGNTTSGWQDPTAGLTAFGAVTGGNYNNSSLINIGYGYWWSATDYDAVDRYYLYYNGSDGQFRSSGDIIRSLGFFVRCVRSA